MITHQIFPDLIKNYQESEDINKVLDEKGDFIHAETLSSNFGYILRLTSEDYNEENALYAEVNGDIYCDKDEFISLLNNFKIDY